MEGLNTYLAKDRRQALAQGHELPELTCGAALFADISGFTALTEALTCDLGVRQGAEELTQHLNRVYDALISEVTSYGGSVIGFSGDAITCWFEGAAAEAARRAVVCGLAMLAAIRQHGQIKTPAGQVLQLAIKAGVAAGKARRLVVGDPQYNYLDVLAGATLDRMAAAERLALQGELVVAPEVGDLLERELLVAMRRLDASGLGQFAVVAGLKTAVAHQIWPDVGEDKLSATTLKPWLLPAVYTRLEAGQGNFLAELRPAVALFLSFDGLDYDNDPAAGAKLNAYICWLEAVVAKYDGALIQLTIGDKGNFLYIAFGAPIAHENDTTRALRTSLELINPPAEFAWLNHVKIGLSQGTMRTGAYGSSTRRTYGVIGDEANFAARLMQAASDNEVLVSNRVRWASGHNWFRWQDLGEIKLRGKAAPLAVYRLLGKSLAASPVSSFLEKATPVAEPPVTPDALKVETVLNKVRTLKVVPTLATNFAPVARLTPAAAYYYILTLWLNGYPVQAWDFSVQALAEAEQLGDYATMAQLYHRQLFLQQSRREILAVARLAEDLNTLSTKHNLFNWQTVAMLYRGWARAEQGQLEFGEMEIMQGLALQDIGGFELAKFEFLWLLTLVQLKAGKPQSALRTVDEALAIPTDEAAIWQGELYRLKGEASLVLNPTGYGEAAALFEQALELNQVQQAKLPELRAATSLARLWQSQGKSAEAYKLLAPIYQAFTEGFDHPDLQAAKALLEN